MFTTTYFEETVKCQAAEVEMEIELGKSSFFPQDNIYLVADGKSLVMGYVFADSQTIRRGLSISRLLSWIDRLSHLVTIPKSYSLEHSISGLHFIHNTSQ